MAAVKRIDAYRRHAGSIYRPADDEVRRHRRSEMKYNRDAAHDIMAPIRQHDAYHIRRRDCARNGS